MRFGVAEDTPEVNGGRSVANIMFKCALVVVATDGPSVLLRAIMSAKRRA